MRDTASIFICILVMTAACSDSHDIDKPGPPLLERYELSSEDSVPEGVAFDPETRTFYATSLQGASIVRIDADGRESAFRPADSRARLGGAKVDSRARRLWVCAQQVDGLDNRVWVLDLATGDLITEFLLAALTTHGSCNDLVLDSNGVAYVTDPSNPYIYRLDPETGEGSVLGGDLYTVSNASVSRVRLNEAFNAGDVVTVPQIGGLSTATVAQSELYVIKSDVTNFVLGQALNIPFEIFRVDIGAFVQ